ncbi:hypothetical protein ACFLUO_04640 [Chloroflexota bacterium]
MEAAKNHYAAVYLDTYAGSQNPLLVEIGKQELWALERILEHAFKSAMIPDVLKAYPKEIIKLGEIKSQNILPAKRRETLKTTSSTSPRVLDRLPYYRKKDIEVSIPIYKAEYAFPLIILKQLLQAKNTPPDQKRLLILDSDGDLAVTALPSEQINKAKRKLNSLQKKGKAGHLICLRKPGGTAIDIIEISELQKQALENVAQSFEETGKERQPLSGTIKKVLNKARETV